MQNGTPVKAESETNSKLSKERDVHSEELPDDLRVSTPPDTTQTVHTGKFVRLAYSLLQEQWLLLGLGTMILIASQVQVAASQQHVKTEVIAYLTVTIIFLITGCTLDTQALIDNYARWRVHLFVQLQMFLMTSAVVFGFVELIATNKEFLDPGLLVGMIFMSCMATTISSNVVMTGQARANKALTVVQTTVGNLIGVFVTPALVVLYTSADTWYNKVLPPASGRWAQIYRQVIMRLGLSLYLPLFVGQVLRWFFPKACKKVFVEWKLGKVGSLCLLVMLWQTYDTAFASKAFTSVPGYNMVFIVFFSIGLYLLFLAVSIFSSLLWLPKKDVVAVTYCVPAKGIAVAVPIASAMFDNISLQLRAKILVPIVIYQCLQLAGGAIFISFFRRWIEKDEPKEEVSEESDTVSLDASSSRSTTQRISSEMKQ